MTFDDQIRAALESTAGSLREHLEAHLRAFSQQAIRAAVEERQQAVQDAAAAATAEVRSQAETLIAQVRAQADAQVAQIRAAAQKHAEEVKRAAETQIAELRNAMEELRAQAQQQLDSARRAAQAEAAQARNEADQARTEADQAHLDLDHARRELEQARAELDKARGEIDSGRAQIESGRAEVDSVRAELARARAEIETTRSEAERARGQVETARSDARDAELSRATRLVDAIRTLDEARGVSEVLDRLIQCAGREVERAAVLVVKAERLAGWRFTGFAEDTPAKSIDLDVEQAGLAGLALQTCASAWRAADGSDGPALPAFAGDGDGRDAMALPILVGGEVVAVLYADGLRTDNSAETPRWSTTLEVIARHGSRVLEAITVLQAAGLPLPTPMAHGSHMGVPAAVEHA